jgi:L-galactose dehydrogenase
MDYRKLGKTDLNLSLIGFGGAALGGVFGEIDPGEGMRAVHLAVDSGINFFDTSPYYGITLAETRLGAALAGRRERVILATKCGRYGMAEFDFSAKRVTASMDESLRRLQTDYIDLFQVHDLEFGDAQQIIDETLPALRQLQQQGKARYVGITGYPHVLPLQPPEHGYGWGSDRLRQGAWDRAYQCVCFAHGDSDRARPPRLAPGTAGSARCRKKGGRILP